MIKMIFSHIWIAIIAIFVGFGEYVFWSRAIHKYKRLEDLEEVLELIIFHAMVIGCASFIYWVISIMSIAE